MSKNLWYRIVAGSLLKKLQDADIRIHTLLNTVHVHKVRITELEEAAKKSKSDADIAVRVIRDLEAEVARLRADKAALYPELDRLRAKLAKFNQR